MWTCPKCRHECDTPFCPLCGYQMPNQYSEVDLLEEQLKNGIKHYKSWQIFAWISFGIITAVAIYCIINMIAQSCQWYHISILLGYAVICMPLLSAIFVSKDTIKLWQNTIGFLKNNR